MYRCKTCLNTSSRPRITFNKKGICNACQWVDEKKSIDWIKRQKLLGEYFKKNKRRESYDCIIPVSGGAGNYKHLLEAFMHNKIDSIATANLLNFVGDGLQDAREQIIKNGISLAKWQSFQNG